MKFAHFVVAAAVAVILSSAVDAEAGLFGRCKKNACCEPVCCKAEPTCCEAEPVCCEPEPACEPAPAPCCEPAPTCCEPEPCCEPDPCCKPKRRCGLFSKWRARRACCDPCGC